MRAALATLVSLSDGARRLAFLGEMLELGSAASAEHRAIGEIAGGSALHALVACGPSARALVEAAVAAGMDRASVRTVDDSRAAADAALSLVAAGDAVLVKGSRGMRMEVVVEALARGSR
jgi:UDP-N-acetylmuramoyl-tripeptide--D-alanyl-D-alanine ligase